MFCCIEPRMVFNAKVHLLYELWYFILCVDNLTVEKSCVSIVTI
jgi:hypothetical protein